MTTIRTLPMDIVDRTQELLADPRESIDDLVFHTGVDRSSIEQLARYGDTKGQPMSPGDLAKLHDWLVLLEVRSENPRFGPPEVLLRLGEYAAFMYWNRHYPDQWGIFILNERAHVLKAAEAKMSIIRMTLRRNRILLRDISAL